MNIFNATSQYESWHASQARVVPADLEARHKLMASDAFSFLRATFYRWAQIFPVVCPQLARAPKVLGVGDLHVENYGTWRDTEGRLIWGINDFDEACPLPYANDLVRLVTSALLAIDLDRLSINRGIACTAVLDGYHDGLNAGGSPFVLSERNRWLRDAVTSRLRDPTLYWQKFDALPTLRKVPGEVQKLLQQAMPEAGLPFRVVHRRAGLGSLGRQRFTALTEWRGGKIAREAKALLPSAWPLFSEGSAARQIHFEEILRRAVRAPDPFLQHRGRWILRRLSPYCSRIELSQMKSGRDGQKLLWAMGCELANVHLGTRLARARVVKDLRGRKARWLHRAALDMSEAIMRDWKEWRKT